MRSSRVPPTANSAAKPTGEQWEDIARQWAEEDAARAAVDGHDKAEASDLNEEDEEDKQPLPALALDPKTYLVCAELSRFYNVPIALPAMMSYAVTSICLGSGLRIKTTVGETCPNIYSILGASSGTGKSLVTGTLMVPVIKQEQARLTYYEEKVKPELVDELAGVSAELKRLSGERDPAVRADPVLRKARLDLMQRQRELEVRLAHDPGLLFEDATSAALGVFLSANGEQAGLISAEAGDVLYNILGRFSKEKQTDDSLYNKAFSNDPVNVKRIGRTKVVLYHPCVTLGIIVQPDLMRMAVTSERLLSGGLLARSFLWNTRLVAQERKKGRAPLNVEIMKEHADSMDALLETYRDAKECKMIPVEDGVEDLSDEFWNKKLVPQLRAHLSDVSQFVARWDEQTWKIAAVQHARWYGAQAHEFPLTKDEFKRALMYVEWFAKQQLKVLARGREEAGRAVVSQIKELMMLHGGGAIPLRTLARHGIEQDEVDQLVNRYPDELVLVKKKPSTGAGRSSLCVELNLGHKNSKFSA